MIMEQSEIIEYYPVNFKTDLNGKQQEWEAVVLIPFIDEVCCTKLEVCQTRLFRLFLFKVAARTNWAVLLQRCRTASRRAAKAL